MTPKAYFLTWTTYGTWLPGDSRGWVDRHRTHGEVVDPPDPDLERAARSKMTEAPVTLDVHERKLVLEAIHDTSSRREWCLHALDVRSNHVHVVISTNNRRPGEVMGILKSYATRALRRARPQRKGRWWTRGGSKRLLFDQAAVSRAVVYVRDQDESWKRYFR